MRRVSKKPEGWLTVQEYAEMYECRPRSVYDAIQRDRLDAVEVVTVDGARIYVNPESEILPMHFVKCPAKSCFLNERGGCQALIECLYIPGYGCPFYKPRKEKKQ